MRRRSALSAIVLERLAGSERTDRGKPADWSNERLAGRYIWGLEQPLDVNLLGHL